MTLGHQILQMYLQSMKERLQVSLKLNADHLFVEKSLI
jgi:hypothetical protein